MLSEVLYLSLYLRFPGGQAISPCSKWQQKYACLPGIRDPCLNPKSTSGCRSALRPLVKEHRTLRKPSGEMVDADLHFSLDSMQTPAKWKSYQRHLKSSWLLWRNPRNRVPNCSNSKAFPHPMGPLRLMAENVHTFFLILFPRAATCFQDPLSECSTRGKTGPPQVF